MALLLCLLAISAIAALLLGACEKKTELAVEPLTYRLKWLFNISVVGDLYATAHGRFAAQGLRVVVKEGSPERDAIKELELNQAQFGVASADQIIRAVSKGAPIVVLSQLFQANPLQWIYRSGNTRVEKPADLKGKTIGITFGGNDETIMRALLSKHDIADDEVRFFSVRYDYTPFYEGEVDLWPIYRNAEGIVIGDKLREAGEQTSFFDPHAFGIRFVANSVITTERMTREHPKTVERFLTALLEGWRESLDPVNQEKALAAIQEFDRDTPASILSEQLSATRRLMKPSPDTDVGTIDIAAWQQTEEIMLEQKLIPAPVSVERILSPRTGDEGGSEMTSSGN
jgi:NitT/TauT family transport system substrate-binding protein